MQLRTRACALGFVVFCVAAAPPSKSANAPASPSSAAAPAPAAVPSPAPSAAPPEPSPTPTPVARPVPGTDDAESPAAAAPAPSGRETVERDWAIDDVPLARRHRKDGLRAGVHEHDGFYMRFALGFSGFGDTVVSETTSGDTFRDQALVSGFSTVTELAIGGAIRPGLVLGGGLYTATLETPFVFEGRGRPLPAEFRRPDTFAIFGFMGDFYPNPRRGLHMQAAIGFATLTGLNPGGEVWRDRHVAVGGGAVLGVGYEWWVGEQWSLGALARGTAGALTEEDAYGERWFHFAGAWPSLLLSATYQ